MRTTHSAASLACVTGTLGDNREDMDEEEDEDEEKVEDLDEQEEGDIRPRRCRGLVKLECSVSSLTSASKCLGNR
jgi:hypothetical protein